MKKTSWWLLLFLSISVVGYALFAYSVLPLGNVVHPDMKAVYQQKPLLIYTHVFGAVVALALGPFQFSSKLRQRYLTAHRWSGRAYLLFGVLFGGLAGLFLAQHAFGGLISQVGFSLSALVWLFTGSMALVSILSGDTQAHRRWMVRNFALTFSAVTLRMYLGAFTAAGVPFAEFYPLLAWISWVPNILLAEWIFNRQESQAVTS
ncbi:DUF2306 domain-containing protein [Reinekea blandensis]|uniref:DUF2306 domain-containing protein n=1 Tax=Reinekea blandensis MED297 TaxID=314283 RepID=A4BHR7_9GAMM|nr:DUF2306 domain-containing protein [Reinekea blandensis]EAR08322.1 hypothetical protein MED297_09286 [Reinekea sp. MED297] [Reinekea blandensis MED297]